MSDRGIPRWSARGFTRKRGLQLAAAFAGISAVTYFLLAVGLAPGDPSTPPAALMFVAGAAYLVGAGLILVDRRWLLVTGAVLNPLVIVAFFVSFLLGNTEIEVMSLISKLSQVALEVLLVKLIRDDNPELSMPE